jgi:hypothetical protein
MFFEEPSALTLEAEFIDVEYLDAEYAKYMNAARTPAKARRDWLFWTALVALALFVYTGAFMVHARSVSASAATVAPNLDLHDCSLPEVKVELSHPGGGAAHDIITPYAHSVCREGDVRLWESTQ